MKAGRRACLRCGEALVPAADAPPPSPSAFSRFTSRWRGPLLAAGIVVPLLGVLATMAMQTQELSQPPGPGAPVANAATTSVAPAVTPPPSSSIPASEPAFLDAARGGTSAYARGDFGAAIARYQEAIEKNPNNLDALNNLGQTLVRTGRAAEAIPYFERAIALNLTNWGPRFNLAHAYADLQDWPKAVAAYRVALQVLPDDYVTYYNLGLALHRQGQEEAAVQTFQKAIELAPGEPTFHLSLGISYERLQKPAEAVQAYEDYLTMAPTAGDAPQVKSRIESLRKQG